MTSKTMNSNISPLELAHSPYFLHKINVREDLVGLSRIEVFSRLAQGKKVLHIGCVDWPITDLKNSLHIQLDQICQLDGFDIHDEAFPLMQPHLKGNLYSKWDQITSHYDLVLIPEVLEHVPDVQGFLKAATSIDATEFIITVPDAFSCFRQHFDYNSGAQTFVEAVHPDHNCWYTPYTLKNVIDKYTELQIEGMFFFNRMSLLAVASKPAKLPPA